MRNLPAVSCLVCVLFCMQSCGSLIVMSKDYDDLVDHAGFNWITATGQRVVTHVEPDSATARDIDAITRATERARSDLLIALEMQDDGREVRVFALDSRERMQELIGRKTNATAYHEAASVCIVWPRAGAPGLKHELAHVITMSAWGVPERWVNEGLAVDLTGQWAGLDLNSVCKQLRQRGELPELQQLIGSFNRLPSAVSYPAAGSFVRFIREQYGLLTVRRIWERGRAALEDVDAGGIDALESSWIAQIDNAESLPLTYDPQAVTPPDDL